MAHHQKQSSVKSCIWMQAGVVKTKICTRDYQCNGCRFDKALRRLARENRKRAAAGAPVAGRRGQIEYWAFKFRKLPAHRRPCVHYLKGRIEFRACTNDYVCHNCEFDQYFQDQFLVHTILRPVDVTTIEGFKVPQGVYLHPGHTWMAMAADGQVRIGLSDFATRMLGPMDRIDLPLLGKPLKQDQEGITMHRQGLCAGLLAPVSGVVTATNPEISDHPETLADDPYGNGWMVMMQPTHLRQELSRLKMGADEVSTFIVDEISGLHHALESHVGPLAADGGQLSNDILTYLPRSAWESVTRQILKY